MNTLPHTPTCVGIILDGNRRFAREHGVPVVEGYRRGFDALERVVLAAQERGIAHVVVYGFSTENWQRPEGEVASLMQLFEMIAREGLGQIMQKGVALRFVGQRERFSLELQHLMDGLEERSPANARCTLWVCLSYGGRAEIVHAAQRAAQSGKEITEETLAKYLWTAGLPDATVAMPDPDLIIRAGGEQRLSNFLLWQSAYSELFFVDTLWPAFTVDDFDAILAEYATRSRRMGA